MKPHKTLNINMKRILFTALLALAASASALAKDIHTAVLTTQPGLRCHNCENKVTEQLRYVKGVKRITASAAEQTIVVVFDADKTTAEALVKSLEKVGYSATVVSDKPAEKADLQPVKPKKEKM